MDKTPAQEVSLRLAEMVRRERHLVAEFVIELADFARRELYRELGYDSLFYYCVRQLGLPKSSSFRRFAWRCRTRFRTAISSGWFAQASSSFSSAIGSERRRQNGHVSSPLGPPRAATRPTR